jgi:tetraspanin-13/31
MVTLFILFVVQFSLGFGCLSFSSDQKFSIATNGWNASTYHERHRAEKYWSCCGFDQVEEYCSSKCCFFSPDCQCPPCQSFIVDAIDSGLNVTGWLGILSSCTELIGVWLTIRYRNMKDPKSHPSAFLWKWLTSRDQVTHHHELKWLCFSDRSKFNQVSPRTLVQL